MARSAILSNGRLAVGLNERGHVHDFYFPYVGLENLTTARSLHHKIGIWIGGAFSWTDDDAWDCSVDLSSDALTATCIMTNKVLGVSLRTIDFVDHEYDTWCRRIYVKNLTDSLQEIRLFMHQVFQISSAGRGDTALYEPDGNYILDYKGRVCLLIGGRSGSQEFDQYAVGNYGIEGKAGTYVDAEDGELSNHPVEHAGVDSVIRFCYQIQPGDEAQTDYWVVADDSQYACDNTHEVMRKGLDKRQKIHEQYWQEWLAISDARLSVLPGKERFLARKSLMTIKAHIDSRGGVIASCDSSIYNYGRDYYSYVWPRDGAYAIWPLIRLGYTEEPKAFIKFCRDLVTKDGYLMHKYQPDRAIGSTWHPLVHGKRRELAIQEDETATLLIALGEYYDYSKDADFVKELYESLVVKCADFLSSFIDPGTDLPHASYDLWEEKFLTTTYTTATVFAGLQVASELAEKFGTSEQKEKWTAACDKLVDRFPVFVNPDNQTFRKGFLYNQETDSLDFDNTVDISSMYGVMTFGFSPKDVNPSHAIEQTISSLRSSLESGGWPRYEGDNYFRVSDNVSNPWIIATLWVAQYFIRAGQFDSAKKLIHWVEERALPSGMFPEQVNPLDGTPKSVTPLVWSHAEYINTLLDLQHRQGDTESLDLKLE